MAQLISVPPERLEAPTLQALLEEFASRDGTDYGPRETPLAERVAQLQRQLRERRLQLLYDADSEQWDLVDGERAAALLGSDTGDVVGDA